MYCRLPLPSPRGQAIEATVNRIVDAQVQSIGQGVEAITVEKVKKAAEECSLSQKLKEAIRTGKYDTEDVELKPYMSKEVRPQLNIIDGVICRGSRVVIPPALQRKAVRLSHRAHQGMSKAKALLRTYSWFPGLDKEVERQVSRCLPCQAVQAEASDQPIKPSELPTGPWQHVEMDF